MSNDEMMQRQSVFLGRVFKPRTHIEVTFVPTEQRLVFGTEDGTWWGNKPSLPDDDEVGAGHGRS